LSPATFSRGDRFVRSLNEKNVYPKSLPDHPDGRNLTYLSSSLDVRRRPRAVTRACAVDAVRSTVRVPNYGPRRRTSARPFVRKSRRARPSNRDAFFSHVVVVVVDSAFRLVRPRTVFIRFLFHVRGRRIRFSRPYGPRCAPPLNRGSTAVPYVVRRVHVFCTAAITAPRPSAPVFFPPRRTGRLRFSTGSVMTDNDYDGNHFPDFADQIKSIQGSIDEMSRKLDSMYVMQRIDDDILRKSANSINVIVRLLAVSIGRLATRLLSVAVSSVIAVNGDGDTLVDLLRTSPGTRRDVSSFVRYTRLSCVLVDVNDSSTLCKNDLLAHVDSFTSFLS